MLVFGSQILDVYIQMCEKSIQKNNVIAGPWKARPKREVILQDEKLIEDQENAMFCDSLTEGLVVQMINTIDENGFEIESDEFLRNVGWVIESIRSCLYKEMGLFHPMADLVQSLTVEIKPQEEKKVRHFSIDTDRMDDILKKFRNDDEKETE